mgnify:CR=1 FL=1
MSVNRPDYAPTVNSFQPIQVSVSSFASAKLAGVGPFRGVFALVSTSLSITDINGKRAALNNISPNVVLWIQG